MTAATAAQYRIRTVGLTKAYPGTVALRDANFLLRPGEIVGLVGQNGAGKSTLVRMLSGIDRPTSGTIEFNGQPLTLSGPIHAQRAGIHTVHQELSLVPALSVAENVCMGDVPRRAGLWVSKATMRQRAERALAQLGFELDVRRPVESLTVGERQAVELARALRRDAQVIILDEPTATLSKPEVARLLEIVSRFPEQGVSAIYISHRMDELVDVCHWVTVLRDGRIVGSRSTENLDRQQLVDLMLGREAAEQINDIAAATAAEASDRTAFAGPTAVADDSSPMQPTLEAVGLSVDHALEAVSFSLAPGEILGVTGLTGSGQSELAECLFGARKPTAGHIKVAGKAVQLSSPRAAIKRGIGLVPEDRKTQGLVLDMSLAHNMTLSSLRTLRRGPFINKHAERRLVDNIKQRLKIRSAGIDRAVQMLSGGNQQKVVIGKWILQGCSVLILDEPTRGVDVGAKVDIYDLLRTFTEAGGSCVLITSEVEEAMLCNRVAVLRAGRLAGVVPREVLDARGESAVLELCGR